MARDSVKHNNRSCSEPVKGSFIIASIDIGSHTARLLISRSVSFPGLFQPIARKRDYINLGDGLKEYADREISPDAVKQTLAVLTDFASVIKEYGTEVVRAVSTGVMRKVCNRADFLKLIHDRTGIDIKVISGREEALLTQKGVLHSLNYNGPFVIFDLGGGTTEFISSQDLNIGAESIPLGALVLTQRFFDSDPPDKKQIKSLSGHIDRLLTKTFLQIPFKGDEFLMIGAGGTVTTLAAMVNRIRARDITPEKLNGLVIKKTQIEDLFKYMRDLPFKERLKLPGLDSGRAGVILAGALAIIRILRFFHSSEIKISFSDILEGVQIAYLQGE